MWRVCQVLSRSASASGRFFGVRALHDVGHGAGAEAPKSPVGARLTRQLAPTLVLLAVVQCARPEWADFEHEPRDIKDVVRILNEHPSSDYASRWEFSDDVDAWGEWWDMISILWLSGASISPDAAYDYLLRNGSGLREIRDAHYFVRVHGALVDGRDPIGVFERGFHLDSLLAGRRVAFTYAVMATGSEEDMRAWREAVLLRLEARLSELRGDVASLHDVYELVRITHLMSPDESPRIDYSQLRSMFRDRMRRGSETQYWVHPLTPQHANATETIAALLLAAEFGWGDDVDFDGVYRYFDQRIGRAPGNFDTVVGLALSSTQ